MNTTITVKITKNYGNEAIYPVCDTAKMFAEIAGTKTMSRRLIDQVKQLGYSIVVEQVAI
jgi:hypothetical protein